MRLSEMGASSIAVVGYAEKRAAHQRTTCDRCGRGLGEELPQRNAAMGSLLLHVSWLHEFTAENLLEWLA